MRRDRESSCNHFDSIGIIMEQAWGHEGLVEAQMVYLMSDAMLPHYGSISSPVQRPDPLV